MGYGKEDQQMTRTLEVLEASATQKGKTTKMQNLTHGWMKAYLLDTHGIVNHTDVRTSDLKGQWKASM